MAENLDTTADSTPKIVTADVLNISNEKIKNYIDNKTASGSGSHIDILPEDPTSPSTGYMWITLT